LEGIDLEETSIFLVDHQLNTITDLKNETYTFNASESIQLGRFTLLFDESLLDIEESRFRESDITLYPNPAQNRLTLNYSGTAQLQTMFITDMNGRRIHEWGLNNFSEQRTFTITGLSPGIYLTHIQTGSTTVVKKLVIR